MTPERRQRIEKMYVDHRLFLYKYALLILGNKSDAEDAVHRTFEIVCKKEDLPAEPASAGPGAVTKFPALSNRKKRRALPKRAAAVAAAFVCVLLLGSAGMAYALGVDVWGAVVRWTESVFRVEAGEQGPDANRYPEPLRNMAEKLAAHGIREGVLPTYLPAGYELAEETYFSNEAYSSFYAAFSKGDSLLSINCTQYYSENYSSAYEKDAPDPSVYHRNGTDYYVFTNYGTPVVCWSIDNLDCAIIGAPEDEIEKLIGSIQ